MTVWKYLQSDGFEEFHFNMHIWNFLWGFYLEKVGRYVIKHNYIRTNLVKKLDDFYPDFKIMSSNKYGPNLSGRIYKKNKFNLSTDLLWLLCGLNRETGCGEKHAITFEIKSGISPITPHHISYWTELIENPADHIKKCDSLKLYVMWIRGFDVQSHNIFYTIKEVKIEDIPPPDNYNDITEEISNNDAL